MIRLHCVAYSGCMDRVNILMELRSTNPCAENAVGLKAADIAQKEGYPTVAKELRLLGINYRFFFLLPKKQINVKLNTNYNTIVPDCLYVVLFSFFGYVTSRREKHNTRIYKIDSFGNT